MNSQNSESQPLKRKTIRVGKTKFYLDSDGDVFNQNHERLGHESAVLKKGQLILDLMTILQNIEANLQD